MPTLLLLYSTREGQTLRIAERAANEARRAGWDVQLCAIEHAAPPARYAPDAVLIAASVHVGRHAPEAQRYVADHRAALAALPTAFLSVSLSAGSSERAVAAEGYAADFLDATGWQPAGRACVAGALRYRQYGVLKRLLMRQLARAQGLPTDTSRDHEYTDWDQVSGFVRDFLEQCTTVARHEPGSAR